MSAPLFRFEHVGVMLDGRTVLDGIDLDIPDAGITVIVRPSGSGKSTLLRLCNRLEVPTTGRVLFLAPTAPRPISTDRRCCRGRCPGPGMSPGAAGPHGNGARRIDHVVIDTDSLDRTCEAIATAAGAPLKRVRDLGAARQGFHRLDTFVIEVLERADRAGEAGTAESSGARFWGLTFTVADPDGAARALGPERCGT